MRFTRLRGACVALVALAAVGAPIAIVALPGTASASAPNTAPACKSGGVSITSYGSTFQTNAINGFNTNYQGVCGTAGSAAITYNNPLLAGAGSGKCITLMSTGKPASGYGFTPFCGSDAGLTGQQWAGANTLNPGTGGIQQFPIAVGAVTVSYNKPSNVTCPSPLVLQSKTISDIFGGDLTQANATAPITDWNQIPGCSDTVGTTAPITRVVRNDSSGTTCIFKSYMAKENPVPWEPLIQQAGCTSTTWPTGSPILFENGNPGVASTVLSTSGTIGYVDLATALSTGNTFANVTTIPETVAGGSENPEAAGGAANCNDSGAVLPPTTASAGWDQVSISDGPSGYPICGYTYSFMHTVNPFGSNVSQAQVDAAVDFLLTAVSNQGQATLAGSHYAPIGSQAQAEDQVGLAAVST